MAFTISPRALRWLSSSLLTLIALISTSVFTNASAADRTVELKLSVGNSWQARNDVQIPNTDLGTRFSIFDAAGEGPATLIRLDAHWIINEKHGLRLLLAPLELSESVVFDEAINFSGSSFLANEPTTASYRFNSWRVGYHYTLVNNSTTRFRVGGTLKVRDAEIRLEQGSTTAFDDDIGLVPLLYLSGEHRFSENWTIGADLDGVAGGPGRASVLGVSLDYAPSQSWRIGIEGRVLDGGANTEEVYNFAQFNSLAVTLGVRL